MKGSMVEEWLQDKSMETEEMELSGERESADATKKNADGTPFESFASSVVFECLLGTFECIV